MKEIKKISREQLEHIIINIISNVLNCTEIELKCESRIIEDLDISSFEMFNILSQVEEKLNIDIDLEDSLKVQTLSEFMQLVERSYDLDI